MLAAKNFLQKFRSTAHFGKLEQVYRQKFRSTAHFGKLEQVYRMALGTSHQDLLIGNIRNLTTLAKPCPLNIIENYKEENADTLDFIVIDTDDAGVMAHPTRPHSYTKLIST